MTVLEILKGTEQMLNSIRVPVALNESVAKPIYQAAANISACVKAIEEADKEDADNGEADAE